MKTRDEHWQALSDREFDLLIVGGGINGCGAARDAALRGLDVALVEQDDWGSGTSSRSAKLVHGGLRYLKTMELGLVRESVTERTVQTRVAPHLVKPVLFVLPVYAGDRPGLHIVNLGLWFYEALALFRIPQRHRMYRGKKALTLQPNLRTAGLKGALAYYDTTANDARLTLENALDAEGLGATTVSHAQVTGLLRDDDGRVVGAQVTDRFSDRVTEVRARLVVNTTGPWTDHVLGLAGKQERPMLRPTKGAHLVFRAERLPVQHAVGMFHPTDRRPLFVIPWGPHVYVGTTDYDIDGDPDRLHADARDRDNLLEAVNHYFPESRITPADIVSSWCGVRPLVAPDSDMSASKVSREHVIRHHPPGLLSIAGGKLTTYRLMVAELVDEAAKLLLRRNWSKGAIAPSQTKDRPLPGAVDIRSEEDLDQLASRLNDEHDLAPAVAKHLAHTYGSRAPAVLADRPSEGRQPLLPALPFVWAELDYAVTVEHCYALEDFFARRTQLLLRDPEGCAALAEEVSERMGELLGWSAERRQAEISKLRSEVQATLSCRS